MQIHTSRHSFGKARTITLCLGIIVVVAASICLWLVLRPVAHAPAAIAQPSPPAQTMPKPTPAKPSFDMTQYSTTNPASIWVIVNKQHPLSPINYMPAHLVMTHGATVSTSAETDFNDLWTAAKAAGVNLTIVSSYRSYSTQVSVYNRFVSEDGQKATDTFSARPGFSEHQTGLAIDFGSSTDANCNLEPSCYGTTVEGKWLALHANTYGYILRYPASKESITGYEFEPWHYRYVGRALASEMNKRSITTLEEFFHVSGGKTYINS